MSRRASPRDRRRVFALRLGLILVVLLLLEIAVQSGAVSIHIIVPPSQMFVAFIEVFGDSTLRREIVATVRVLLIAGALTLTLGFLLGAAIHALPRLRRALDPVFSSYYALPIIAFYPLFIVIFGATQVPVAIMGFLTGVTAMILCTLNGFDNVPKVLEKVGRLHRMSHREVIFRLKLPSAAPYILGGMRLTVAYVFLGVVASEFIMSGTGIGHAIAFAYNTFEMREMYGLLVFLILMVIAMNLLVGLVARAANLGSR